MIIYHGSPNNFTEFKLDIALCQHDPQTVLTEGVGVYMTMHERIAKNYGKYLYKVSFDEGALVDMTTYDGVRFVLQQLLEDLSEVGVVLYDYIRGETIDGWLEGVILGDYSCTNMDREVALLLDSEESFYTDGNDYEIVVETLEKSMQEIHDKYVFKFNDKSLGAVYIAKNPSLLNIVEVVEYGIE